MARSAPVPVRYVSVGIDKLDGIGQVDMLQCLCGGECTLLELFNARQADILEVFAGVEGVAADGADGVRRLIADVRAAGRVDEQVRDSLVIEHAVDRGIGGAALRQFKGGDAVIILEGLEVDARDRCGKL